MLFAIRIRIGFLWFSQMRAVLKSYRWLSPVFEWEEGSGWLDKTFYIKGSRKDIYELSHRFHGWCSEVEKVE